jgi:hypothetical protein
MKGGLNPFFRFADKDREIASGLLGLVGIKRLRGVRYPGFPEESFRRC